MSLDNNQGERFMQAKAKIARPVTAAEAANIIQSGIGSIMVLHSASLMSSMRLWQPVRQS